MAEEASMKHVKTHTFNGRKYKIRIKPPLDGLCSTYKNERELIIMASLQKRGGIITAIHEALHAENWKADEEIVDRISTEIGSFLWRLGYRIKDD